MSLITRRYQMKHKGLCLMLALALGGVAVAAQAQDAQSGD